VPNGKGPRGGIAREQKSDPFKLFARTGMSPDQNFYGNRGKNREEVLWLKKALGRGPKK